MNDPKFMSPYVAPGLLKKLNCSEEHILNGICEIVYDYLKVNIKTKNIKHRNREFVDARHISMYFCTKYTSLTLVEIGNNFGNRDHSTISHACTKINELCQTDKEFKKRIDVLNLKIVHEMDLYGRIDNKRVDFMILKVKTIKDLVNV